MLDKSQEKPGHPSAAHNPAGLQSRPLLSPHRLHTITVRVLSHSSSMTQCSSAQGLSSRDPSAAQSPAGLPTGSRAQHVLSPASQSVSVLSKSHSSSVALCSAPASCWCAACAGSLAAGWGDSCSWRLACSKDPCRTAAAGSVMGTGTPCARNHLQAKCGMVTTCAAVGLIKPAATMSGPKTDRAKGCQG